jgi:hypothetical protein
MSRDKLFLIEPGFHDPKRPGQSFVCPYCNQIEGLLATFPDLAKRVDVVRVPFPRPRKPVIALLGEENQSLPVLVFGDDEKAPPEAAKHGGKAFVADTSQILNALAERHGFPRLRG